VADEQIFFQSLFVGAEVFYVALVSWCTSVRLHHAYANLQYFSRTEIVSSVPECGI